jgi:hypothetical protein
MENRWEYSVAMKLSEMIVDWRERSGSFLSGMVECWDMAGCVNLQWEREIDFDNELWGLVTETGTIV